MPSTIAIHADNLGKCYRIFDSPRARLAQGLWGQRRKLYQEKWALRGVSFELPAGQTLGVVGRNGSGKSTLLQLLCGTLTPTEGGVQCHGRVAGLLELGSGFNPEFSGIENVFLNASLLGLDQRQTENKLDAILAFADIGEYVYQPVKTYSSGMALRLAFAVQANIDPNILIVDEALAVGDELFQKKCYARLSQLKASGTSILLVTHSCAQIIQHCDQALLLHKGQPQLLGKPSLVTTTYQQLANAPDEEWAAVIARKRALQEADESVKETAADRGEADRGELDAETCSLYTSDAAEKKRGVRPGGVGRGETRAGRDNCARCGGRLGWGDGIGPWGRRLLDRWGEGGWGEGGWGGGRGGGWGGGGGGGGCGGGRLPRGWASRRCSTGRCNLISA